MFTILFRALLAVPGTLNILLLGFISVALTFKRWASFRSSNIRPGHGPAFIGGWQINGFGVATHDSSPVVDPRARV